MAGRIFHIAFARDWERARTEGAYRVSTRGASLDEVGFIHASFKHQLEGTLESFYADVEERLLVLVIDAARVAAILRVEAVALADGAMVDFPHLYGPLPASAVIATWDVRRVDDGSHRIDASEI